MQQTERQPMLVLDTCPCITDITSFDAEYEAQPERFKCYFCKNDISNPEAMTEDEKESALIEVFSDDTWLYEDHWDCETDYLKSLLKENGFGAGHYLVTASPCNWTGRTGELRFEWDGEDINEFIRKTFALVDPNNFRARIWEMKDRTIRATASCHDIPMGATITIEYLNTTECVCCGEVLNIDNKENFDTEDGDVCEDCYEQHYE